jgi:hypothetical protein
MTLADAYEYKGYIIELYYDEYADSPAEWENEDVFLGEISTRRYSFGKRKGYPRYKGCGEEFLDWGEGKWFFEGYESEEFDRQDAPDDVIEAYEEWEEIQRRRRENNDDEYEVFPVGVRDYGGGNVRLVFVNDPDDADGYIFVRTGRTPLEQLTIAAKRQSTSYELADALLDEWNQYLEGDVYCLRVLKPLVETVDDTDDPEQCEEIEPLCGGYYGDEYARKTGEETVDWHLNKTMKEAQ